MKHLLSISFFTLGIVLLCYFFNDSQYFTIYLALLAFAFLGITALGSSFIQLNYFVRSINQSKNKGIAITFDDGPDNNLTPQLLDLLHKEEIKATFFIIGSKIKGNESLLKKIHQNGHIIGNHSFSHDKKLTYQSSQYLKKDVERCNNSLTAVIGAQPRFFRPPFGITTPRYNRVLNQLKLTSIGWNIRSFDTTANDQSKLYNKVVGKIKDGSILLFHDTQQITLNILPDIIKYCKQNGIKIVPLSQLINQKPYV